MRCKAKTAAKRPSVCLRALGGQGCCALSFWPLSIAAEVYAYACVSMCNYAGTKMYHLFSSFPFFLFPLFLSLSLKHIETWNDKNRRCLWWKTRHSGHRIFELRLENTSLLSCKNNCPWPQSKVTRIQKMWIAITKQNSVLTRCRLNINGQH